MSFATVIIPTYNRPEHLAAVLDALTVQAEATLPFSVVVVDDGSAPPVRLGNHGWPFDVRLVRFERNRGRAAARNAGLGIVGTPLAIFLDDDMRPLRGFVRGHVEAVDPGKPMIGLGSVTFHPDIPRDRLTTYLETRGVAKLGPSDSVPFKYFLTYNSAAPTELLRRVGGFDERLRAWGGEDLELGWRLHGAGARFIRVPRAQAHHAHRRSLDDLIAVSVGFGEKSLPLILEKHPQLVSELRVDLFGPVRYRNGTPPDRIALRAVTRAPFPSFVRRMVSAWPRLPWPTAVFDYLIVSAWRCGLDRAGFAHSAGAVDSGEPSPCPPSDVFSSH